MASSILKLEILKGPRNGETLEFNPRSTIRIGRVARGNNLTIKDSGISSKHLEIKFNSDSGKWVISDLDSSNGTIVNSSNLEPLSPFEIFHGDVILIGEITKIRVEIGEQVNGCRNPRRQAASKRGTDGSNLGENVVSREEIDNCRNPRKRAATRSGIDFGGKDEEGSNLRRNVEIREENKIGRNLKRQAASKRGPDLGNKVEVREDDGLNLEEEEMKEEGKGRRGRGRGRPKKVSNLEDGNVGVGNLGVRQNVESVKLKPECGVSTRRTRRSKRGEDELVSLVEAMPARRTRRAKNADDVLASSVLETVVESKGLDMDNCKEVESINAVEDRKTRGGRGRKKKVGAECLENVQDAIPEEKMNHEVLGKEVPDMVVDLKEQPCEEPVDDASEKNVVNDAKNEQSMEVEVPELEGGAPSVKEHNCAGLMDETNQQDDCVVSPLPVEERVCDVVESDAVFDDGRTEESEIEEGNRVSEANCYSRTKDPATTIVPDLEKMTLEDWFNYLEVYLPKQIYAATDEIIEDMRKQAIRFDDFMVQQQKEKSKLPSATEKTGS